MKLGSMVWVATLKSLGRAFVDVLEAEWSALNADLSASGRRFARGVVILVLALALAIWVAALASLALIAYLSLFLEMWQAVSVVAAGLLVIAVALFFWAKSVFAGVIAPSEVVQTRIRGHVDWLHGQIDPDRPTGEESEEASDGG